MKKLAIFLAIMLIPFSAFALDTISDNDLNDVTGQAGVSIYTNSIQIVKTGVTTTYTDWEDEVGNTFATSIAGDALEFNIVTTGQTTKIFFKGVDPLMIDIINMQTLANYLADATVGLLTDDRDFGDTAVMITLPNAIEIINVDSTTKTYYTGAINDSNRLIGVTVTGGTTLISHADRNWKYRALESLGTTIYGDDTAAVGDTAIWSNSGKVTPVSLGANKASGDHSDQIVLLITAHED